MKLTIIGASGHGKVVADIAMLRGYDEIVFLDDDESIKDCAGFPVIGKTDRIVDGDCVIAVGNAETRSKLMAGKTIVTLTHPSAIIAKDVLIGAGTVVMAGAVINPGAVIGRGCIVNTCSSVDHDCLIGDFTHISVGAHLSGTVSVGDNVWIGAGATVSNNINICENCIVGAGAVVIKDIKRPGTYVGVPAKRIENGEKE